MRFIPTRVHGIMDYLAVIMLLVLPRLLPESRTVTTLLLVAAGGLLVISLCTRYELGLVKRLPMRAHLVLDLLTGLTFLGFTMFLNNEAMSVRIVLGLLGLLECGLAITTQNESSVETANPANADGRTIGVPATDSRA